MLVSVRYVVTLHLALSKCFKTSASNSLRHKKKAVLDQMIASFADDGTTLQNICTNVHNFLDDGWHECLSQKGFRLL